MIYRAVFHVDLDDSKPFALALANVGNLLRAIPEKHYDVALLFNGPAVTLLQTEQAAPFREEIWQLQQARVHPDEIARAIKQARAIFAYGSENITNQAFWLGYSEMFDDYSWFTRYTSRLAEVTPEILVDTVRKYLNREQRVVGIYYPDGVRP